MNYYAFCLLNLAILATIYGLLVILLHWRGKKNRLFFLYCFSVAIWSYFYAGWQMATNSTSAELLIRLSIMGAAWIPAFHFHFVSSIFDYPLPKRKLIFPVIYFFAFIFSISCFTPYQIASVEQKLSFPYWPTPGPLFPFYTLYFIILIFYAMRILLHHYYQFEDQRHKQEAQWLLIATLITYISAAFNFLLWYDVPIPPVLNIFISVSFALFVLIFIRYETQKSNPLFRKCSIFIVLYSVMLSFSMTSIFPLINWIYEFQHPVLAVFLLGGFIGGVLSLGPFIYAYLLKDNYWLKVNDSLGLAHELKSPFASIRGAVEILTTKGSDIYFEMIGKNIDRLDRTVSELLNIASAQHGDIHIDQSPFHISTLIEETALLYKPFANNKKIIFELDLDRTIEIKGDPEKIKQVVSNLLINAVKYTDSGAIQIGLHKKNSEIVCVVKDSGRGIPEEHLHKIFERFYQANKNQKGSGIGLSVAKA